MLIFYNASDMQVMALYSGTYSGTVWTDQGYVALEVVASESDLAALQTLRRDCYIAVVDGSVTTVTARSNPVQPQPNSEEAAAATNKATAQAKLRNLGLTDDEINALRLG